MRLLYNDRFEISALPHKRGIQTIPELLPSLAWNPVRVSDSSNGCYVHSRLSAWRQYSREVHLLAKVVTIGDY